jgi:predicted DNA-binding transcriptional regulator AlpA
VDEDKEGKEDEKDQKPSEEHALQLRDLRRTVETELATLRVPRESRALLLSHGLSGVQVLHYDCHDVEPEVREALQVWHRRLAELEREARVRAEQAPNVVPIAKARGRKSVTKKRAVEPGTERLLTLAGLARSLSMGKTTVKEMLARGELPPGIDIGGAQRWKWDDVLAWIQKRSATPAVVRAVA